MANNSNTETKVEKVLIADDIPSRHTFIVDVLKNIYNYRGEIIHTYNVSDTIAILKDMHKELSYLFLDHDFDFTENDEREDGSKIAREMAKNNWNVPTHIITINPIGSESIHNILSDAGIVSWRTDFISFWEFKYKKILKNLKNSIK